MSKNKIQKIINKINLSPREKIALIFFNYYRVDNSAPIFKMDEIKKMIGEIEESDRYKTNQWFKLTKMIQCEDLEAKTHYLTFLALMDEISILVYKYDINKNPKLKVNNMKIYSLILGKTTTYSNLCYYLYFELDLFLSIAVDLIINNYIFDNLFGKENLYFFKCLHNLSGIRKHCRNINPKSAFPVDPFMKGFLIESFLKTFFEKRISEVTEEHLNYIEDKITSNVIYENQKIIIRREVIKNLYKYFPKLIFISEDHQHLPLKT